MITSYFYYYLHTVGSKKFFEELEEVLDDDEFHLLSKISNLPEIKLHDIVGESFIINTGIIQRERNPLHTIFNKMFTFTIPNENQRICIKPKFADELTSIERWYLPYLTLPSIGTSKIQIDEIETKLPIQLVAQNYILEVNASKTE